MYSKIISEKCDVNIADNYHVDVLYTHFWGKIDIDVEDSYHIDVLYTHFREMWCRCRRLMKYLQFWQIAQASLQSKCTLYSLLSNMLISEKYAHFWEIRSFLRNMLISEKYVHFWEICSFLRNMLISEKHAHFWEICSFLRNELPCRCTLYSRLTSEYRAVFYVYRGWL